MVLKVRVLCRFKAGESNQKISKPVLSSLANWLVAETLVFRSLCAAIGFGHWVADAFGPFEQKGMPIFTLCFPNRIITTSFQ